MDSLIDYLLDAVASKRPKPMKTDPLARLNRVILSDLFNQNFILCAPTAYTIRKKNEKDISVIIRIENCGINLCSMSIN